MASFDEQIQLAVDASSPWQGDEVGRNRTNPRFEVPGVTATCTVVHPGGSRFRQTVPVVDCSASGIQIVWPGFVHAETTAEIELRQPGQEPVLARGTCKWCRFLSARYHAVGIELDAPIPIRKLVTQEQWLAACARNPELQKPLAGRVLVISANELTVQSIRLQLSSGKLAISNVDSRGGFLDAIERGDAEILVIDADDDTIDAAEILRACRARMFNGPIVLISMDRETDFLTRMDPLDRCRCVSLPMQPDAITNALRDVIREHPECAVDTEPIYSDVPHSSQRDQLLRTFIDQAVKLSTLSIRQLDDGQIDDVKRTVKSLAANGGSYGFHPVSDAAERFLAAAADPAMKARLPSILQALQSVVARLDAGPRLTT